MASTTPAEPQPDESAEPAAETTSTPEPAAEAATPTPAPAPAPEPAAAAPVTAAAPHQPTRFGTTVRRHRIPIIVGAAALVVGLLGGGLIGHALGEHQGGDRFTADQRGTGGGPGFGGRQNGYGNGQNNGYEYGYGTPPQNGGGQQGTGPQQGGPMNNGGTQQG